MGRSEMVGQHTMHRNPQITGDLDPFSRGFAPQNIRDLIIHDLNLPPI
jgi:hypothetical protein